jgi:hypothetical protein
MLAMQMKRSSLAFLFAASIERSALNGCAANLSGA